MSSPTAPTYAAAAGRSPSPTSPKYIPVHKRGPSDPTTTASLRSSSPTPSEVSATSSQTPPHPSGVYSIASLLHLAQEPQVKLATAVQRETLRQVFPEILMSRKMRKGMEYHAIQERIKAQMATPTTTTTTTIPMSPPPLPAPNPQMRQRPGQRRQGRVVGTERRRNATKIVDEASWRTLRPIRLVVPTTTSPQHVVSISAA